MHKPALDVEHLSMAVFPAKHACTVLHTLHTYEAIKCYHHCNLHVLISQGDRQKEPAPGTTAYDEPAAASTKPSWLPAYYVSISYPHGATPSTFTNPSRRVLEVCSPQIHVDGPQHGISASVQPSLKNGSESNATTTAVGHVSASKDAAVADATDAQIRVPATALPCGPTATSTAASCTKDDGALSARAAVGVGSSSSTQQVHHTGLTMGVAASFISNSPSCLDLRVSSAAAAWRRCGKCVRAMHTLNPSSSSLLEILRAVTLELDPECLEHCGW